MTFNNWRRRDVLAGIAGVGGLAATSRLGLDALVASAQAQTGDVRIGRELIGKLEGPEIVVDPTLWPKNFKEAPELAAKVAAKALPPVAERIGKDPLVIKPLREIGVYGGTWRRGFTGPGDMWNAWRTVSGPDHLLYWDYSGSKLVPNIVKSWSMSEDGKALTLKLREGMRWSDGHPFTADDFVFWFEDIYNNKELVRFTTSFFSAGGKQGKVEKIDTTTIRFAFENPYFILPEILAGTNDLAGHAMQGRIGLGLFAPAHYLKQFHPKYTPQADLDRRVKDSKLESWVKLFLDRNNWVLNPDLPAVTPWILTSPINRSAFEFARNPYSIWVDSAGNQLPYINKVSFTLAENLEVVNLRTVAGEYDFQERHVDMAKLPILLKNRKANNYEVYLDPGEYGTDMFIGFNHTYKKDPEIAKWFSNVDFRRALSLGIDRDEMNEIFWLGMGQPRSIVPADDNFYNPGPQYARLWATHEPAKANALLDAIGLTRKDREGFRLRSDGKGRLSLELMTFGGSQMPYTQMAEMVREHWKAIGIDLRVMETERSLGESKLVANEHQMFSWVGDGTEHLFSFAQNALPVLTNSWQGPLWGVWYATNGKEGEEPAPYAKKALDNFRKAATVPEKERIALAKEIWALLVDNVHFIGTVGLSPAFMGVRVVKNTMGNIPARQYNSPDIKNSSSSRPMSFYFKA